MVDPSRTYRRNHGLFQRMTDVRHITGGSHVLQEKWSKYLSLSIVLHISKSLCANRAEAGGIDETREVFRLRYAVSPLY
jgi:hypothetical protein